MNNTEDYPGPTRDEPDKKGGPTTSPHPENPQATEKIVKPTRAKNNEGDKKNNTIPEANRNP
jgi:hypothetical protein